MNDASIYTHGSCCSSNGMKTLPGIMERERDGLSLLNLNRVSSSSSAAAAAVPLIHMTSHVTISYGRFC